MEDEVVLDAVWRGDHFEVSFTLSDDWLGINFNEVSFTVRRFPPKTTVTTDESSNGVLAKVTLTGGGIVFAGNVGTVTIPNSVTTLWPAGDHLYFDCRARIDQVPVQVHTLAAGRFYVRPDMTRVP